jgi:FAD/FMN-containing dehydrogenase
MATLEIAKSQGEKSTVPEDVLEEFQSGFRGRLVAPGDDDYDTARRIWNGTIDRRPALIAECTGTADVIAAVNFAAKNDLLVSIRGGGHSWPGHSVADDALMIDLSHMRGVRLDLANKTVRAQGGAQWGDVNHETQAFGLAAPGGVVSETGIGGLTVGGGAQTWLVRKYGSAADNLISADVVTADGRLLTASETENEDLFWAIRGGGGNFGVVTSFEFRLHPVGPIVLAGPAIFSWDRAREVTEFYVDFVKDLPDELTTALFYWTAPPVDFLPESMHGEPIVLITSCYAGPAEDGEAVVAPIRALGPEVDMLAPMPYSMLNAMFDPLLPKGTLSYAKSDYFDEISDAAIDVMLAWAEKKPPNLSLTHLNHFGGAVARLPNDATPFAQRDADFAFSQDGIWTDPAETDASIEWVKGYWEAMRAFSPRGAYVNFMDDEGEDRIREAYQDNYDRLVAIKTKYDPTNLFHLNQNIRPSGA